ncbi:hypothetical protein DUNSADRAFT_14148 [Dunaliella salina]|uniref:Encoded protein n=1 Tax=Dunaliella salina TaxID=3046 RepID=A0ABQ7H2Q8_DUNSA|nr:hypothetical protein DUNSADRAFT_14148 [Dunaliella salina]|eukprot:KAF5841145.1 hypothetical protein DUNSADRAFT_14148 [Dunaliella salina]
MLTLHPASSSAWIIIFKMPNFLSVRENKIIIAEIKHAHDLYSNTKGKNKHEYSREDAEKGPGRRMGHWEAVVRSLTFTGLPPPSLQLHILHVQEKKRAGEEGPHLAYRRRACPSWQEATHGALIAQPLQTTKVVCPGKGQTEAGPLLLRTFPEERGRGTIPRKYRLCPDVHTALPVTLT